MINSPVAWLRCCALLLLIAAGNATAAQPLPLDKIKLPLGFEIGVLADNVPNARAMALGDQAGAIYRISYKPARWAPS